VSRRPERLLPFACIAAAACMFASELMTTFQFEGGALGSGNELCDQLAADRHHFALGVLAIFAVVGTIIAVLSASKPAAMGVGIAGLIGLLIFLIADLPDANNVGTLSGCSPSTAGSFFDAKAVPQPGFWLEMVGALGLALSGAALATLTPDQLGSLRPRWLGGPRRGAATEPPAVATTSPANPDAPQRDGSPESPAEEPARARRARRT
jgi:hypothetical protein